MSAPSPYPLVPHPATPCAVVERLQVRVDAAPTGWHLRYVLTGDLARLRVPPPAAQPVATDGLWQHTCFEAFVGQSGSSAYREFNFSPCGNWAAYAFRAERERDPAAPALPAPRITCEHDARTLTLVAWLHADAWAAATDLWLGLTAVIETQDGALSYWAMHHPAAKPDFHHRGGWTARVKTNVV